MARLINEISIKNKIGNSLKQKRFQGFAYQAALAKTTTATRELLKDYDEHPVTQDLNGGNVSKDSVLPYGNLYSFLGFNVGEQPASDLRDFLENNIEVLNEPNFRNDQKRNRVFYEFPVIYPSLQEIYNNEQFACPSDLSTKSWPQIIQDGIGTFASYVYHEFFAGDFSHSKTGLQRKKPRKNISDKVQGIKWLSEIFANFKDRFK